MNRVAVVLAFPGTAMIAAAIPATDWGSMLVGMFMVVLASVFESGGTDA